MKVKVGDVVGWEDGLGDEALDHLRDKPFIVEKVRNGWCKTKCLGKGIPFSLSTDWLYLWKFEVGDIVEYDGPLKNLSDLNPFKVLDSGTHYSKIQSICEDIGYGKIEYIQNQTLKKVKDTMPLVKVADSVPALGALIKYDPGEEKADAPGLKIYVEENPYIVTGYNTGMLEAYVNVVSSYGTAASFPVYHCKKLDPDTYKDFKPGQIVYYRDINKNDSALSNAWVQGNPWKVVVKKSNSGWFVESMTTGQQEAIAKSHLFYTEGPKPAKKKSIRDFFLKRKMSYSQKMALQDQKFGSKEAEKRMTEKDKQELYKLDNEDLLLFEPDAFAAKKCNLVTSKLGGETSNRHAISVDIDHQCHLIASRTPGHYHLYVEKPVTWAQYKKWLQASADIGLLEQGYVDACISRGFSTLRKDRYDEYIQIMDESINK